MLALQPLSKNTATAESFPADPSTLPLLPGSMSPVASVKLINEYTTSPAAYPPGSSMLPVTSATLKDNHLSDKWSNDPSLDAPAPSFCCFDLDLSFFFFFPGGFAPGFLFFFFGGEDASPAFPPSANSTAAPSDDASFPIDMRHLSER